MAGWADDGRRSWDFGLRLSQGLWGGFGLSCQDLGLRVQGSGPEA